VSHFHAACGPTAGRGHVSKRQPGSCSGAFLFRFLQKLQQTDRYDVSVGLRTAQHIHSAWMRRSHHLAHNGLNFRLFPFPGEGRAEDGISAKPWPVLSSPPGLLPSLVKGEEADPAMRAAEWKSRGNRLRARRSGSAGRASWATGICHMAACDRKYWYKSGYRRSGHDARPIADARAHRSDNELPPKFRLPRVT
jgi:hypothetical protein